MTAEHPGVEAFARWLDVTMSDKNIKGRDLAERLDVHDSAVSRWRSGRNAPNMETLTQIAKLLKVDPLRLAATAGLIDGEAVGVEPLPMPQASMRRESVRRQILAIKGLTNNERHKLLETYEQTHSKRKRGAAATKGTE